uniref:Uncharacterized protein n=1 Tax=Hyaloperonospora arabidopsidis (strain Emoy2) TaxID=559515 RepID=M4BHP2_HYAAE
MLSMFSSLELALDGSCAVVSSSKSAAKDLLASKSTERQAEADSIAAQALKRQQQKERQRLEEKEQPVTALRQAMDFFAQEVDEHESFVSRSTRQRHKSSSKRNTRVGAETLGAPRGRRHRQVKYNRV